MIMWVMSDRAIPRSFRFMEGFGVHTFRLVNAAGQIDLRQIPLEAEARAAVGRVERGGEDQRRRSGLSSPRPLERDQVRATSRNGNLGVQLFDRGVRRQLRLRRARRDQAHSRGEVPGPTPSAGWCSTAWSTISSPRPSKSRSARRTSCRASTSATTRCCRAAISPISTRS